MNTNLILFTTISILILIAWFNLSSQVHALSLEINKNPEPMENFWKDKIAQNVTGLYIPNCAYVVDVRNREIDSINNTDNHEACHALINDDRNHFCGCKANEK